MSCRDVANELLDMKKIESLEAWDRWWKPCTGQAEWPVSWPWRSSNYNGGSVTSCMEQLGNYVSTSCKVHLVDLFGRSPVEIFMVLVHIPVKEGEVNVSDRQERKTFVNSGNSVGAYIWPWRNLDLVKRCSREERKYTGEVQQIFATYSFVAAEERGKRFVLVNSGEREGSVLWFVMCCSCIACAFTEIVRVKNTRFCNTWRWRVQLERKTRRLYVSAHVVVPMM